jgi:hypothetical protein
MNNKDCKNIRLLIAAQPSNGSSHDQARIDAHLRVCPDCAALAHDYAEQNRLIRNVQPVWLTSQQREKLFARIQGERKRHSGQMKIAGVLRTTATAAIAIAGVMGITALLTSNHAELSVPLATPTALKPQSETLAGQIIYDDDDTIYALYVANLSTFPMSMPIVVSETGRAYDRMPACSPAVDRIAFVSERDGNPEIYMLSAHSLQTRLGDSLARALKGEYGGTPSADADEVRLTDNTAADLDPAWSPDGSKLAFSSDRDGNQEIYILDVRTLKETRLTHDLGTDGGPDWSPDGSRIAFISSNSSGKFDIYVMNVDGSQQPIRLTDNLGNDGDPAWSPDGSKIAFTSDRTGNFDIYVMNADGSNQTQLTSNRGTDISPVWSPDGALIAFVSTRFGDGRLYHIKPDGSEETPISVTTPDIWSPCWMLPSVAAPTPHLSPISSGAVAPTSTPLPTASSSFVPTIVPTPYWTPYRLFMPTVVPTPLLFSTLGPTP